MLRARSLVRKDVPIPLLAAACSGGLLAISYSSEPTLAWFSLVPLMLVVMRGLRPALAAFAAGFVFSILNLSWLLELRNNGGPLPLVAFGLVALSAWCALFLAAFGYASGVLWREAEKRRSPWFRFFAAVLLQPLFFVAAEYLRSFLFTGFPWNPLAATQYRNPVLLHCTSWAGAGTLTFVIVLVNSAVALLVDSMISRRSQRLARWTLAASLLVAFSVCASGIRHHVADGAEQSFKVAVVNPVIPSIFEMNEETVAAQGKTLVELTSLSAMLAPDLCVWPETSLPGWLPMDPTAQKLAATAVRELHAPLLAGGVEVAPRADAAKKYDIFNSAFLFTYGGAVRDVYRKQHLVPFGEYTPLESVFPVLSRFTPTGLSCTAGRGPRGFEIAHGGCTNVVSPLICFEDAFPALSRKAVLAGADTLVVMANDAWFAGSSEPEQHLAQSVLRCAENNRPMVRSANSGVSCVIAPDGRVVGRADKDEESFVVLDVPSATGMTPYTRYGDWLLNIPSLALTALFLVYFRWRGRCLASRSQSKGFA